ncbi:MAG TPA: protein translocase subunit SecF, partial [Alloacidobacterium sp.]|nr:protein translocase subunit SecF [Alloacidobacterium sp.]
LIFSVAGVLSLLFWHGLPQDVDFRGGTVVRVKFDQQPNIDRIRNAADKAGIKDARIQSIKGGGQATSNEVIIQLAQKANEASLDASRSTILQTLETNYSQSAGGSGKFDLDNEGENSLANWLVQKDPEHLGGGDAATQHYAQQASAIFNYRNGRGGLIDSIDSLGGVTTPAVLGELKQDAYLSGFTIRNVEIVGPQVGAQLKKQALLATLYSLLGMLVYLWFRFELIYGVAAVVAVFHDTLITVGAFSLTNTEISLTVVAAILTLVGYSMNDTIVVFDRIRENLRLTRREPLADIVNRSINQTLSRTVLTSGLTFLTVLSLYLFGGEVLHGFSFALVIGILIGTYSSIAVAAPMLVAYQEWRQKRGKTAVLPAAKKARV